MTNYKTPEEWEFEIGRQIRELRLRQNIDQQRLAEQAGVALNVVKRLESGKGTTVSSLIKVLRILGREEWLKTIAPVVSISPLQMLKDKPVRQRASGNRVKKKCIDL
jgi:transcriptional regulator with XRE-family HTH domain